jgi:hypothetical protein
VDGLEIVASLVLLDNRRSGCRSGRLPWAALVAGMMASLAANAAAASAGPVSRVIAGWPSFALLLAVKLLSGMLEHRHSAARPTGGRLQSYPLGNDEADFNAVGRPTRSALATRPSSTSQGAPMTFPQLMDPLQFSRAALPRTSRCITRR